jgi:hypothetical protein
MTRFSYLLAASALVFVSASASAAVVNIDLSGAASGTLINGVGGDFAQTFAGQTVNGAGIDGAPTNPLTLAPAGEITVAFFNPGVSPASNSLLSQPGNAAPLSLLLDSDADSITFTAGFFNGGSVTADFFSNNGTLVGSQTFSAGSGYSVFTANAVGVFRGLTFRDNNDGAGLRFMNFSYNTVDARVPEPATWGLMILGFGLAGAAVRRTSVKVAYA